MHEFLEFFFHHLEAIIMGLTIAVLAIGGGHLIYTLFFKKPDPEISGQASQLEITLKKIIEQTGAITSKAESKVVDNDEVEGAAGKASAGGSSSQPQKEVQANSAELSKLKGKLDEKQGEIEKLSSELKKLKLEGAGTAALEQKIKELEARLSEYEIIEDDIADLSKYKDENARLKEELKKLKGDSGEEEVAEETPAPEVEAAPEPGSEPVVEAETTTPEAEVVAEPEVQANSEETSGDAITEDLINEFEKAVSEQEAATEKKAAPEKKEATAEPAGDDLFSEFTPEEGEDPNTFGDVNTDKMMEEMSDLDKAAKESTGDESALDKELDVEKMAGEAQALAQESKES